MNDASPMSGGSLPASVAQRIDQVCDRFEAAWKAGQRPTIEEFLGDSPEPEHSALLRELLSLELAYRRQNGEQPTIQEYTARSPKDVALIQVVFNEYTAEKLPIARPVEADKLVSQEMAIPDLSPNVAAAMSTTDLLAAPGTERGLKVPQKLGRYELQQLIGEGGFGQVWKAFDPQLNRCVAIKLPREGRSLPEAQIQNLLQEARKVATLPHPGIVPVYDVGLENGVFFVVSKLMEGGDLEQQMTKVVQSPHDAAHIVAEIAIILQYAHSRGFVHRDIKPGNILLDDKGRPVIADFGLAVTEEELVHQPQSIAGTLVYMSPEQAAGNNLLVDCRTDIYSLGVIFYQLLSRKLPFFGSDPHELRRQIQLREPRPLRIIDEHIPRTLEQICLKCLAKKVTDRFTTAIDLVNELENYLKAVSYRSSHTRVAESTNVLVGRSRKLRYSANFEACLVFLYPTGPTIGTRHNLSEVPRIIGREETCHVCLDYSGVSRRHALISPIGGEFEILDLQSSNGTFVNDIEISSQALHDGDYVRVGNCIFRFFAGHDVESGVKDEIYRLTIIDPLTSLHNRRGFLELLSREIAVSLRYRRPLSLIVFEIGRLQQVTEAEGDLGADFAVRGVGQCLREMAPDLLPRDALIARLARATFAVVLPDTEEQPQETQNLHQKALQLAESLRARVAQNLLSFQEKQLDVPLTRGLGLTLSIGLVTVDNARSWFTGTEVLKRAEENLARASETGDCVITSLLTEAE